MYFSLTCTLSVKNDKISTKFIVIGLTHYHDISVSSHVSRPVYRDRAIHNQYSPFIWLGHPFVLSGSNALIHRSNTKETDDVKYLKQTSVISSLINSGVNQFRVVELQNGWRSE